MAEAFLKSFDAGLEVYSAGTTPSPEVNPYAIETMKELGFDISSAKPKHVSQLLQKSFDYVVTACDDADKHCPPFTGTVKKRVHIGFEDPARASGTEEEVLGIFREVRDQIRRRFSELYANELRQRQGPSCGDEPPH
jgi:arsenate reductase (thioredoxin)